MKGTIWLLVVTAALLTMVSAQKPFTLKYAGASTSVLGASVNNQLMLEVQGFASGSATKLTVEASGKKAWFVHRNRSVRLALTGLKGKSYASLSALVTGLGFVILRASSNSVTIADLPINAPAATQDVEPTPTPPPATPPAPSSSRAIKSYSGSFKFARSGFEGHGQIVFKGDGVGSYRTVSGTVTLDLIPAPFNLQCTQTKYQIGSDITPQTPFAGIINFTSPSRYALAIDGVVCPDGGEGEGGLQMILHSDPTADGLGLTTASSQRLSASSQYLGATLSYDLTGQP